MNKQISKMKHVSACVYMKVYISIQKNKQDFLKYVYERGN